MNEVYDNLINKISNMDKIQSIGKTGSPGLPFFNESDVDIFIFCDEIPEMELRLKTYKSVTYGITVKTNELEGKHWGIMDFVDIDGLEICLMYFTIEKAEMEIDEILKGNRLQKEDGYFYPIGRCATLYSINVICDKTNFLKKIKEKLSVYPKTLHDKNVEYHLSELNDTEDLERAVKMQDVLFYHFALDIFLDHYLQLLFSLNYCYYPSRKRNILYINGFTNKPNNCVDKIMEIVKLSVNNKTLNSSYEKLKELVKETKSQLNIE